MSKPNILFIYSDQHRYDCVGAHGHPLIQTPALDQLATTGVDFTQAYTPIPMCVPARCSLLCGQWPSEHGVVFNYDGETFKPLDPALPSCPTLLRDAGYFMSHVGRWHVDPEKLPTDFGFHTYVPIWRYTQWRRTHGYGTPARGNAKDWLGGTDAGIPAEASKLAWSADQVLDQIATAQQYGDPFFIRWHTIEPHLPCYPPEPYASMYAPEQIEPWPGWADSFVDKPYAQKQLVHGRETEAMTWEDWAPVVGRYLGEISLLDHEIGRVLAFLEAQGVQENTLVIYTSDHGDMCGSHHMVDKHCAMYDDVVRVPMLMRWPGTLPQGRVVESFVCNAVDLPATLCHVAEVTPPDTFRGQDLLPLAGGTAEAGRADIFACYFGNQFGGYSQRMVRDPRWKYVWNSTDLDELYDLQADPGELTNRIHDPVAAAELPRLRQRMLAWMEETHDRLLNSYTRAVLGQGLKVTCGGGRCL